MPLVDVLLAQPQALQAARREVRDGGHDPQVLLVERRGVGGALEGHAAGDALGARPGAAEPQRGAEHRPDAAVLGRDAGRDERPLGAQHPLGDRGVDGHGREALDRAHGGQGPRGRLALEEGHQAPLPGDGLEEVDEQRLEEDLGRGCRHHRRRGAGQYAEDPALARQGAGLEARARGEIGDVAQPRPGLGQPGVGGRRGVAVDEDPVGHPDLVPVVERLLALHADAVEAGAVEAAEVPQHPALRPADDLGVAPREQHVGQDQVAFVRAAEHHPIAAQGEDLARSVPRRQSQVRHALSFLLTTRRSRSPRRGGSTRPTSSRAPGRRRPR